MEKSQNTKVNISIMMVQFTWETLFKIKEREKEECIIQMARFMKVFGLTIYKINKANISTLMETFMKVSLRRAR